jgi:endogenous inhibitor of DNA gyrase (YacG/DUF329 family)
MKLTCPVCQREFERYPSQVRTENPCCSKSCYHQLRRSVERLECPICGGEVRVSEQRRRDSRSGVFFCSRECRMEALRRGAER